jgi:hypothetical protein
MLDCVKCFILLSAKRADDATPLDYHTIQADVSSIPSYIENKKSGTSVAFLSTILITRNQPHLIQVAKMYQERQGTKLSEALAKAFSGHLRERWFILRLGLKGTVMESTGMRT